MTAACVPADPVIDDGFVVLDDCHRRMLATVGLLEALAARLGRGELDADDRAALATAVDFLATEVAEHHRNEERFVFPLLAASKDQAVVVAVLRLRQDHGWLEEDWRELAPQLQALAAGYSGWDPDTLRSGVALYAALLRDHIALEETLVYPQARARLGEASRHAKGRAQAAARRRSAAAGA